MKQEYRLMLVSIMAGLQSLEDRYQIRSEGEQTFKTAKVELQKLIDAPGDSAEIVVPVGNEADEIFKTTVLEKLDGFEDALSLLVHSLPDKPEEIPA